MPDKTVSFKNVINCVNKVLHSLFVLLKSFLFIEIRCPLDEEKSLCWYGGLFRGSNSPALFIPRGIGASGHRGMPFFHSLGNGELKFIPRGIGSGNRGIGESKFSK